MTNFLKTLFPLQLHLTIFQLEGYQIPRFLIWNLKNLSKRSLPPKKPLIYTTKIKHLLLIYILICLISFFINIFLFFLLIFEPFIGLIFAVIILKPYEIYNKSRVITKTKHKILSIKNLKIIAITGSFGKTSTKEILYQLIKKKFKTLRTPESFNTIFGIAKVVDLELDNSYTYFICEMAAYKIGEIKTLTHMVPPHFGILTGITTQHLERFGSLKNTIKAKFELVDAIKNKDNIIFNLDDANILPEIATRHIKNPHGFVPATNITFTKTGSAFDLLLHQKTYHLTTSLFGFANIKNIQAASAMALKIGLSVPDIIAGIKNLTPIDNRFVLQPAGKSTLVNNTFSSNVQAFKETLKTAQHVQGTKVLVTPGLVELGNLESKIHKELGQLSQGIFTEVILVGKNTRTTSFAMGLTDNYTFINDNRQAYFKKLDDLKKTYDWIFLENDLTQNY